MKLSQLYADFNVEVLEAIPYMDTNKVPLKVDAAQALEGTDFLTAWIAAYLIYSTVTTHTAQSVTDVKNLYNLFHPYWIGLKQQIKKNTSITLTGTDIAALHIHVDAARRTAIPAPVFAPANQTIQSKHLTNKIFTNNPSPGLEDDTALPTDVAKVGRRIAVKKADEVALPADYHVLNEIGSTTYDLVFTLDQKGSVAWLITYYVNARGEHGPDSDPLQIHII